MSQLTSNGQITARDIRQLAVDSVHLRDDSAVTRTIPDQAVTFPDKIDDPIWTHIEEQNVASGVTVGTTLVTAATVTVSPPAWVDQVSVFALGAFQLTKTTTGDVLMSAAIVVDGDRVNGGSHENAGEQTQRLTVGGVSSLVGVAGGSFAVDLDIVLSAGSNTNNNEELQVFAVGTR